jgi:hypothetical protein
MLKYTTSKFSVRLVFEIILLIWLNAVSRFEYSFDLGIFHQSHDLQGLLTLHFIFQICFSLQNMIEKFSFENREQFLFCKMDRLDWVVSHKNNFYRKRFFPFYFFKSFSIAWGFFSSHEFVSLATCNKSTTILQIQYSTL